jgi:hypothetical protein
MPDTNFRGKQGSFRLALVVSGLLWLALLLPGTVWAGGHTVNVPPPNGVDDTANIQAALNACVASGKSCTLQLQAGTYHTKQLVTYNFQGTFKGMGQANTTIEALPNLLVNFKQDNYESLCQPNTTTCFWPSVVIFVNGNISVSDLSIYISAPPGTATTTWIFGGVPYIGLLDALSFIGQQVNATVDRIHMEGLPDPTNTVFGFNVVNALHFSGEFPRSLTDWDWYFLSGSLTVRNSSFSTAFVGISQDGFVKSSRITIGGSPSTGNHLENGYGGIDIEASEHSVFEISYNESSGVGAGLWVVPWQPVFVPTSPSWYSIHDNTFIGTAQYADGMYLYDDATNPWIQAGVWNNTIELQNTLMEGIGAYNTKGTAIWNNNVTGTDGNDGIGLWSSTLSTVIGNNVSGFTVDPTGYAQIYLDPSTTRDLVVCAEPSDTVLNQGTDNMVIGCQPSAATSETAAKTTTPAASTSKPDVLKRKPRLR